LGQTTELPQKEEEEIFIMPTREYSEEEFSTLNGMNGYLGKQFAIDFPSSNKWGFPDVAAYNGPLPDRLVGYNEISKGVDSKTGIHFYMCDSKFESVWNYPARSMSRLSISGASCILGPDFSQLEEWPLVVRQYNKYRAHWCMALWQKEGFNVIPNISWSGEELDDMSWCWSGLPINSVLAVSTIGIAKYKHKHENFLASLTKALVRLCPTQLLVYGSWIEGIGNIKVWRTPGKFIRVPVRTYRTKWQERGK
jgi:hypothetical protein